MLRLWFADAAAERAFQLHYGSLSSVAVLIVCLAGLLTHVVKLFKTLLPAGAYHAAPYTPAQVQHLWARMVMFAAVLIMYPVFGWEGFVLHRGVTAIWAQLLFACGCVVIRRPAECGLCAAIWRHRLVFINVTAVVALTPACWYWFGGVLCWLVGAAADVADPGSATCGHSLPCLLAAMHDKIVGNPAQFMLSTIVTAVGNNTVLLVDVVVPGVLLTWLEVKSRRGWLQRNQPHLTGAQQHWQQPTRARTASSRQQANEQQQVEGVMLPEWGQQGPQRTSCKAPSCSATTMSQDVQEQLADCCGTPNQLPHAATTGGESAPPSLAAAVAPTQAPAAAGAAGATVPSVLAALQHPAPPSQSAAPSADPHSTAPAATAPALIAAVSPAAARSPAGFYPGTAAVELQGIQQQCQRQHAATGYQSNLYCSPIDWCVVSVKFNQVPCDGHATIQHFHRHLAAALHAAAQRAMLAAPTVSNGRLQHSALVTNMAAFPGCYQVLLQLALPKEGQPQQQQQLFLQDLQEQAAAAVHQMVASWPDAQLISIDLRQLQHQQQQAQLPATAQQQAQPQPQPGTLSPPPAVAYTAGAVIDTAASPHEVSLQPVVVAMAAGSASSISSAPLGSAGHSSSTRPDNTAGPAERMAVALCLSKSVVQRLRHAGQSGVRVVVAPQQPDKELLMDQTWQLVDAQPAQGAPTATAAAAAAADATAGLQGSGDLCLPLRLDMGGCSHQQVAQCLTVVVLMGGTGAVGSADPAAAEAAAEGLASSSHTVSVAGALSLHGVVAKLPLLLLPGGAAGELQNLFDQAVSECGSHSTAYHQLLPLLTDLGGVLCASSNSTANGGRTASQQALPVVLLNALSACFAKNRLHECMQLLDRLSNSTAAAEHTSHQDEGQRVQLVPPAVKPEEAVAPDEAVTAMAAAETGVLPDRDSLTDDRHGGLFDLQGPTVGSSGSSGSGSGLASSSRSNSGGGDHKLDWSGAAFSQLSSVKGAALGVSGGSGAAAGAPCNSPASFHAAASPPGALRVGLGTILHGFPVQVETAYRAYKNTTLMRQDAFVLLLYTAGIAVTLIRLVVCLVVWQGAVSRMQTLAAVLRALFIAIYAAMRLLVWEAAALPHRLGTVVQRWRSTILYGSSIIITCVAAACMLLGADWAEAVAAVGQGPQSGWYPLLTYRHIVHPAAVGAAVVPDTLCYLALQLLLFDPVSCALCGLPMPQALGLGVWASAVLVAVVHLAVAVLLEACMRRSFVQHLIARRQGSILPGLPVQLNTARI